MKLDRLIEIVGEEPLFETDSLNLAELRRQAEASGKPKLTRAAELISKLAEAEAFEYTTL